VVIAVLVVAVLVALDLRRDTWDPWDELEADRDGLWYP
jgi:hypothetical protein